MVNMKNWTALLIAASLSGTCLAQSTTTSKPKRATAATSVKQDAQRVSGTKFSMAMLENGSIAPGLAKVSVPALARAIEKTFVSEKGEFESTTDYESRKQAAMSVKVLGDTRLDDTFAFTYSVGPRASSDHSFRYSFNADTNDLQLFAYPNRQTTNGIGAPVPGPADALKDRKKEYDAFDEALTKGNSRTYVASNAYGATVTVEEITFIGHGVAANRIPFINVSKAEAYRFPEPLIRLVMDKAKAAKELPALKALIVMKLNSPYVTYNRDHSKPTRDYPTETYVYSKYVTGDVLGIVYYSGLTGEIIARLPENFGMPGANASTN